MQEAVLKVQKLGVPPEGFEASVYPGDEDYPSPETGQLWEDYQDAVDSITRPVTWEEAEVLVKCCPTDHMSGIEWTMLHCIESVFSPETIDIEKYRKLIEGCNSDMMRELLLLRLQNFIDSRE